MCSPSQPAQPTSTVQTTIPEYAAPAAERMIGQAEALTNLEQNPYQIYDKDRIAAATPEQQAARTSVSRMGAPGQVAAGTNLAQSAGITALGASKYAPGQFNLSRTDAPDLYQYQMGAPQQLQPYQMGGPQAVQGGLGSFTGQGTAEQFMSPYMQQVVDIQKREAIRDAEKGQIAQNLAAARQGTYGGSRQALASLEKERNLGQRLSDIQATGSQAAFDAAQRMFEAEQGRGLQAGLQTQRLGQEAGAQNLAARLGVQQLGSQQNLETERQNLAARLGVQQFGAQQDLESQRLNQLAGLEAQRMGEQSRQFAGTLGLQGAQTAGQLANTLGQLGTAEQQQALNLAKAKETFGGLSRADEQAKLDIDYQDYLEQKRYPYAQLGFMSDILRGTSGLAGSGSKAIYETPPSVAEQIAKSGLSLLSLYPRG
jgi:hypothetical protein